MGKPHLNPQTQVSFRFLPWKRGVTTRIVLSPCGNYKIKRNTRRYKKGTYAKATQCELYVLDKNEDWQSVGFFDTQDDAKIRAGFKKVYATAGGEPLNDLQVEEYLAQKEVA